MVPAPGGGVADGRENDRWGTREVELAATMLAVHERRVAGSIQPSPQIPSGR